MFNAHLVGIDEDIDCDGRTTAAHLIRVPLFLVPHYLDPANHEALMAYCHRTGQVSTYYDYFIDVVTLAQFRKAHPKNRLGTFDALNSWEHPSALIPYARVSESWNPWVYDDTRGIPALDYTHDEMEA